MTASYITNYDYLFIRRCIKKSILSNYFSPVFPLHSTLFLPGSGEGGDGGGVRPQSPTGLIEETQYVAYIGNKGYENGNNIILVKHGIYGHFTSFETWNC